MKLLQGMMEKRKIGCHSSPWTSFAHCSSSRKGKGSAANASRRKKTAQNRKKNKRTGSSRWKNSWKRYWKR